jgi:hypothetical protein
MREQMKGSPSEDRKTILGDVLRVDGDTYFMKWQDGKFGVLHTDHIPLNTRGIKPGERIEAKVDDNNHALSLSRLV